MLILSNLMSNYTYFNTVFLCMWLQVINKFKFIHKGHGHIKVKVRYLHPFNILCSMYSLQAGGLHSTEMRSCVNFSFQCVPLLQIQMRMCKKY